MMRLLSSIALFQTVLQAPAVTATAQNDQEDSRRLATMEQKWNIPEPVMLADALDINLIFNTTDFVTADMVRTTVYDYDCEDGEVITDANLITLGLISPVQEDQAGSGDSIRQLNLFATFNPDTIAQVGNDNIYQDTAEGATLRFCVKVELMQTAISVPINDATVQCTVEYDLTDGFYTAVSVSPILIESFGGKEEFAPEAYWCKDGIEVDENDLAGRPGEILEMCVRPDQRAVEFGLGLDKILEFTWIRTDEATGATVQQDVIADGELVDFGLSELVCDFLGCRLQSILRANFFVQEIAEPSAMPSAMPSTSPSLSQSPSNVPVPPQNVPVPPQMGGMNTPPFVEVTGGWVSTPYQPKYETGDYFIINEFEWAEYFGTYPALGQSDVVEMKQCRNGFVVWKGPIKLWNTVDGHLGLPVGFDHGRRNDGTQGPGQWETGDLIVTAYESCPGQPQYLPIVSGEWDNAITEAVDPGRYFTYYRENWIAYFGSYPADGGGGMDVNAKQCRDGNLVWEGSIRGWHRDTISPEGDFGLPDGQDLGRRNPLENAVTGQWATGDIIVKEGEDCPPDGQVIRRLKQDSVGLEEPNDVIVNQSTVISEKTEQRNPSNMVASSPLRRNDHADVVNQEHTVINDNQAYQQEQQQEQRSLQLDGVFLTGFGVARLKFGQRRRNLKGEMVERVVTKTRMLQVDPVSSATEPKDFNIPQIRMEYFDEGFTSYSTANATPSKAFVFTSIMGLCSYLFL